MKQHLVVIVTSVGISSGLTGCQILHPKARQPSACHRANVLLSDLKKPMKQRQYKLRSGVTCHES